MDKKNKIALFYKDKKLLSIERVSSNLFEIKGKDFKYLDEKIPPVIQNTLPEGVNRKKIVKEFNIDDNDFDLLKILEDGLGGINVTGKEKKVVPVDFDFKILKINELEIEDKIKKNFLLNNFNHTDFNHLKEYENMSVSGYQPKFTAVLEKKEKIKLRLSNNNEYSNVIVKIENSEFSDINIIEYLYLKAINNIGIETVKTMLIVDLEEEKSSFLRRPKAHLIVKRFDRNEKEPIMAFELLALMGKQSEEKYTVSLDEVLDYANRKLLKKNKLDKKEYDKIGLYYYLSFISHNADAHPKNITLLYDRENDEFRVAPFYDIVNTFVYGIGKDNYLGIPLIDNKSVFKEEELLDLFKKYDIDTTDFDIVKDMFFKNLKKEIDNFPFYEKFKEAYNNTVIDMLKKDLFKNFSNEEINNTLKDFYKKEMKTEKSNANKAIFKSISR
jgi:hypothetical protein